MITVLQRILLTLSFILIAENAGAIIINGNRLFSDNELIRRIDPNSPNDSIIHQIKSLYIESGYFETQISISPGRGRDKEVNINEGRPTRIDSIRVAISPPVEALRFDDLAAGLSGRLASLDNLNAFADECIDRLAENGRPFANGQWLDFGFSSSGNISAAFRIMPGPYVYIAGIKYNGLKRTRPYTLDRIVSIKIGEPFVRTRIENAERLLEQMPYLDIDSPFVLESLSDGDSCIIVYTLRELPSTRFDGAAAFSTLRGKSGFVGRLDFEFGDILGTGRSFGFLWSRKDRLSNEIRLRYLEPFVFGSRLSLKLEAFQADRDTSFIESGGAVGLLHDFGYGLSGVLWLTIGRTVPEVGSNITSSTSRSLRLEFEYDKTDRRENPTTGYDITTNLNYKYRSNRISQDSLSNLPTKLTSAGSELGLFWRASSGFVTAMKFSAWGIISSDAAPPPDELRYLGGFENLRGYSERRFPTYRYAQMTLEPRLITGKYSRAYLFLDLAEIKSSQNDNYRFWPGYGLGMVAPSALGQFRLEIGWGKSGFPSEAIINFGLAGQF